MTEFESCEGDEDVPGFRTTTFAEPEGADAGTVPVIPVSDGSLVSIGCPRSNTCDPVPKFVPLTRIFPPAATGLGDTPVIVGASAVISISNPEDVPPAGPGFVTVTVCLPSGYGVGNGTVNCVDVAVAGVSERDPTLIVEFVRKFEPVNVSVTFF